MNRTHPAEEVNDVRLPLIRPRAERRAVRKVYDHAHLEKARERAWLESNRYRVSL
jgi:hypothetical protein